ncbi:unnamed protein product [Phytophthora fragariaefolia]|uniref:Unnamed protein product n=1 Tax=Phytophthora fragariaefolia TaxID=1490495 RepID=A0A9W6TIG8_9STRA|nr:unnamed protein product [Phytophthora fragariaefolia]
MLSKSIPDLSDIVIFDSPCTVHRDTKKTSLGARGKPAMIIGKSDEMIGYRVYIPKARVMVVTSGTWSLTRTSRRAAQARTLRGLGGDERRRRQLGFARADGGPKAKSKHRKNSRWTREKHETRSVSRKAAATAEQLNASDSQDVSNPDAVNSVRVADPKNYGQAMRRGPKNGWIIAMVEECKALEENGMWTVVLPPVGSTCCTRSGSSRPRRTPTDPLSASSLA